MCVNIATGRVSLRWTDVVLPGSAPFELARSYVSDQPASKGILGGGWRVDLGGHVRWETQELIWTNDGSEQRIPLDQVRRPGQASHAEPGKLQVAQDDDVLTIIDPQRRTFSFEPLAAGQRVWPLHGITDRNGNETLFRYDTQGRIREVQDQRGRRYLWQYDAAQRLAAVEVVLTGGEQHVFARYEYNLRNELIAVYDALGNAVRYEYDNHLLLRYTNRGGGSRWYEYDDQRRCIATWLDHGVQLRRLQFDNVRRRTLVTDSLGYSTLYEFNEAGLCVCRTDATGVAKRTFYGDEGQLLASEDEEVSDGTWTQAYPEQGVIEFTDPTGSKWTYHLDAYGSPIKAIRPEGGTEITEYDPRGNVVRTTSSSGKVWEYAYDHRGRRTLTRSPDGRALSFLYSEDGRRIRQKDQYGELAEVEYSGLGYLKSLAYPDGSRAEFQFDLLGHMLAASYPGGNQQAFRYDAQGKRVEAVNSVGARFQYRYDAYGNLLETINPNGGRSTIEYDSELRVIALTNAKGEQQTYEYDPAGRLKQVTRFDGRTDRYTHDNQGYIIGVERGPGDMVQLKYDGLARVVEVTHADGVVNQFEYSPDGNLLAASNTYGQVTFEYQDGCLIKELQANGTVSYQYDIMQRPISIRVDGRELVRYAYDLRGRVTEITDAHGYATSWVYPATGSAVLQRASTGWQQEQEFGPLGLTVHQRTTSSTGELLIDQKFGYDGAMRVVSTDKLTAFDGRSERCQIDYDAADQIARVRCNGKLTEHFSYDPTGNLVQSHDLKACEYAKGNRLTRADDEEFQYDHRGNCVARSKNGINTRYQVGPVNELTQVERTGEDVVRYEYDPFLRRTCKIVGSEVTKYIWSGPYLAQERDSRGALTEYTYDLTTGAPYSLAVGGVSYALVNDHLRAPWLALAPDGTVAWRRSEAAYGTADAGEGALKVPFKLPGQYLDAESGLAYNRTRYFDPVLRRYLSQDILGYAGGPNYYLYSLNDPLNRIDPLGLACFRQECDDAFKAMDNAMNTEHRPPNPVNSPHPNPPNHKGLKQRAEEMNLNTGWMPMERLPGDPVAGGSGYANTVLSHIGEYWQVQEHLQRAQNAWWTNGCHPDNTSNPARANQVARDADDWATRPIPDNVPSGDPALMRGIRMFRQSPGSGLWLPVV